MEKMLKQCMADWMVCDFTSFSTVHVFPSHQDDGLVIMEGCV